MTAIECATSPTHDAAAPGGAARSCWPRIGAALAMALVPLLLLALPLPPTKGKWAVHKQDWVLGGTLVVAALAAVAYFVPSRLFPRRRMTLPLIVMGTALLVAGNATWNKAFRHYVAHHHYSREVFRRAMHSTLHWPIYGRYDNAVARWTPLPAKHGTKARGRYSYATLPWVLVSCAIAGAWYAWARRRPLEKRWDARAFAVLLALQLGLIFFFALCEPPGPRPTDAPQRLTLNISGYAEFKKDIPAFNGIADTLRNYVAKMPDLQWYGQHYPPGNLILLEVERALGIPGLTKAIVVLMTALSAVPLYSLSRELELDGAACNAALLMFTATTGVLVYCTINTTSLLLMPATMCLWLLVRSMKTGSAGAAVGLGVCFVAYLLFSFSASILGVLMALTAALAWWNGGVSPRNLLRTGAISLAAVGLAIAGLYVATDFNLVSCFVTAVRGHQAQQGNEGFDDLRRYLLRSTGNVLAYVMSIVPLSLLALAAIRHGFGADRPRQRPIARALFLAVGLTVLIAGFSGLFYAETERIWIFLTPLFALAAGHELVRRSESEGRRLVWLVFLLVLLISCSQEFFFMHYR